MRVSIDQVEVELPRKIASAVAQARDGWKGELEQHLAAFAARAASELEHSRNAWLADQNALLVDVKKNAAEQLAGAREHWRRETEEAQARAEANWKTSEAERLSKSQAESRGQFEKAAAELRARCERAEKELAETSARAEASSKPDERERGRLMSELAAARGQLADRDTELAESRKANERAEADIPEKIASAVAAAREAWKVELQQQVAESRNSWLAAHNALLVEAKKRAEEQLAEAREKWRRDEDSARAKAEAAWKQDESERLAKIEAEWREKSQKAAAELEARCQKAEAALAAASARAESAARSDPDNAERAKLIEELAAARIAMADREAELAHTRSTAEQALERVRLESGAAMARVQSEWNDAELARAASTEAAWRKQSHDALAKAEEQWRKTSAETLAAATARFEHAEAELAKLHAEVETERGQDGEGVARRLRDKIVVLQATLAEKERELAHARLSMETRTSPSRPRTFQQRDPERESRRPLVTEQAPAPSKMPRDIFIVGLLAATIVVQLPRLEGYIPESWWNMIGMTTEPQAPLPPPPSKPQQHDDTQRAALPMTTVVRGVNVRSDPAKTASLVGALDRGTTVAVIGQHGNWTEVRFGNDKAKIQQGWVYSSFLKTSTVDAAQSHSATKSPDTH